MLRLSNITKIVPYNNKIYLIDDDINEFEPYDGSILKALNLLMNGCEYEDLLKIFKDNNTTLIELLNFLKENNFLRENTNNIYKNTLLEKQWYYLDGLSDKASKLQYKISNSVVAILGVGGVGTIVIDNLVRAGVENFILIDFDIVKLNNLNRQVLYTMSDLGKSKLDCACKRINEINPNAKVKTYHKLINKTEDLNFLKSESIDILINAADQPSNIECIVHEYAFLNYIASISCGVGRNYGSWGPLFIPNNSQCYKCFLASENANMEDYEKEIYKTNSEPLEVAFGPINSIVSTFMAKDVILYLALGYAPEIIPSINGRCGIDCYNLEFKQAKYSNNACECWKSTHLGEK